MHQIAVGRAGDAEIIGDDRRRHGQAELRRHVDAAGLFGDELFGEPPGQRLDDRGDVVAPHRKTHVGDIALIERRVLHPKKKILASRDRPHPGLVDNLEIGVSIEHLDHVVVARHERRAVIWIGAAELIADTEIGEKRAKRPEG